MYTEFMLGKVLHHQKLQPRKLLLLLLVVTEQKQSPTQKEELAINTASPEETRKGMLITGSNASGKSTFLKTVAINALLAQSIHTCLAGEFETCFFRICSSMSLKDDVLHGESYYMVEIKSIKRILDLIAHKELSLIHI